MMENSFRTAYVYVCNVFAGVVRETDEGYLFSYDEEYRKKPEANFAIVGERI